jgi:hypothetical protein
VLLLDGFGAGQIGQLLQVGFGGLLGDSVRHEDVLFVGDLLPLPDLHLFLWVFRRVLLRVLAQLLP